MSKLGAFLFLLILCCFQERIDGLGVDSGNVFANDCAISSSSVKSAAADILMAANSCVSNTVESIERELNDTYSSIESILARINFDKNLAETCVADNEYGKTEMALRNAIVTALCVSQAKKRILITIKDDILTRNDTAIIEGLYNDALNQLTSCDDSISSFVANTDSIYRQIMTCIPDSQLF